MAEHIMLVTQQKRCRKGCGDRSVKVTELMNVERYSHVMHLVSNGRTLGKDLDAFDVLGAVSAER
jgi:anthranilate/para-aminobenzoate synthase component I